MCSWSILASSAKYGFGGKPLTVNEKKTIAKLRIPLKPNTSSGHDEQVRREATLGFEIIRSAVRHGQWRAREAEEQCGGWI
jgi:hypothetical protein